MADYGTKYRLEYYSFKQRQFRLELRKKDYSGAIHNIIGSEFPATIKSPGQGDSKFTPPVLGSSMEMRLRPNINSVDYDFYADLTGINDREWQAVLEEKVGEEVYEGSFKIDSLNVTNNATDPSGSIEITHVGGLANEPTCYLKCVVLDFPTSGSKWLDIYAAPSGENWDSPNAIYLDYAEVIAGDTQDDWIDRWVAARSNVEKLSSSEIRYTLNTYEPEIDTNYQIKVRYYEDSVLYPRTVDQYSGNFTGSTTRQWIRVYWIDEDTDGSPRVTQLAEHYYSNSESVVSVADVLADQIDGVTIEGVTLNGQYYYMIEFEAVAASGTIDLTLLNVDEDGNGVEIKEGRFNDTYMQVEKMDGSDYAYNLVDFSGGDSGGDYFGVYIDNGSSQYWLVRTFSTPDDTAETIINRLITKINNYYEIWEASVDENDSTKANLKVFADASTWQYKFLTDGGSSLTPSSYVSFSEGDNYDMIWIGWVVPENYERQHIPGKPEIKINAVDGLGGLKNFDFEVNEEIPFQKLTILKIIVEALRKTGLNLRLYEAFDLYPTSTDGTSPPLIQIYRDASGLVGKSAREVLDEMVKLLKGRLVQHYGRWEIIPLDQLTDSYTYRVYDHLSNYITTKDRTDFIKNLGGETRENIMIGAAAKVTYENPYKQVITTQDFGLVPQLIKLPNFNYIIGNLNNSKYPWDWAYDDVVQSSFLDKVYRDGDLVKIAEKATAQSGVYYLRQEFKLADIESESDEQKQFELDFTYQKNPYPFIGSDYISFQLILSDGSTTLYLRDTDLSNKFTTDPTTIQLDNFGDEEESFKIEFNFPDDFTTEVDAELRIYQQTDGEVAIKYVKIDARAVAPSKMKVASWYNEVVTEVQSDVLEEKFELGDALSVVGAGQIYKNILYRKNANGDYIPTTVWVEDPDASSLSGQKPIVEHLRHLYLKGYATQVARLEATIRAQIADLYDIQRDKTDEDRLYMLIGGDWNTRMDEIKGEWQEINISDAGLTRTDQEKVTEESTGSDAYSTNPGGGDVDLTNYVTVQQLENALKGKTGSFTGNDLDSNYEKEIYHNLGITRPFVYLYRKLGTNEYEQIDFSNYRVDTEGSGDHVIIRLVVPVQATDTILYRIL